MFSKAVVNPRSGEKRLFFELKEGKLFVVVRLRLKGGVVRSSLCILTTRGDKPDVRWRESFDYIPSESELIHCRRIITFASLVIQGAVFLNPGGISGCI